MKIELKYRRYLLHDYFTVHVNALVGVHLFNHQNDNLHWFCSSLDFECMFDKMGDRRINSKTLKSPNLIIVIVADFQALNSNHKREHIICKGRLGTGQKR